jgi:hypothetical protein
MNASINEISPSTVLKVIGGSSNPYSGKANGSPTEAKITQPIKHPMASNLLPMNEVNPIINKLNGLN